MYYKVFTCCTKFRARSLDFVVSFGERNSAFIIAQAMRQAGIPTDFLDTRDVIRTDAHFGALK